MNLKRAANTVALCATLGSPVVFSGEMGTNYVGMQYANVTYDESGFDEFNPSALVGRFGHYVTDKIALEGRVGFGISDDSATISGVDVSIELDNMFGVYGVGYLPLGNRFDLYGMLGFTRGELTATAEYLGYTATVSEDDSSITFGLGGEIKLSDTAALNAEYTNYLSDDNYDLTALSVGVTLGF